MTVKTASLVDAAAGTAATHIPRDVQQQILRTVADIRYGSVEVVIQDGKVVQIESREKQRIKDDPQLTAR
jgi:hypothetical protein